MTRLALLLLLSLVSTRALAAGAPEPTAAPSDAASAGGATAAASSTPVAAPGSAGVTSPEVVPAISPAAIAPGVPEAARDPLAPASPAAPLPGGVPDGPPGLLHRWWFWVAVGAGVAAVAGGTWFALARDRGVSGVSVRAEW